MTRITKYALIWTGSIIGLATASRFLYSESMFHRLIAWLAQHPLFTSVVMGFIMVYTAFSLSKQFPKHIHQFRSYKAAGQSDAGVWLAGILAFLFYAIMSIDQGVIVYLVRSMNEGCNETQLAVRASIPMMLYLGVGMMAYLIQPTLRKLWGDRIVNIGSASLAVVTFSLIVLSIYKNSFLIYCICKGLSGMLMGIIFNSMYALPLIAKHVSLRNEGLEAITLSCLGAYILFISIGGYISQYLGYGAVYVVSAILAVIIVCIVNLIFPKNGVKEPVVIPTYTPQKHNALRFLLSGKMISYYLGVLLPFGMMNAYCYYLYPMYASNNGISVSELANMIVIGYFLAYIFGARLIDWKNRHNGLLILVSTVIIMALMLIAFSISGNILWATFVLLICCIMVAIPRSEANVYIANESKRTELDVRDTNSGFVFALDATESAVSPLMGWCVSMGLVVGTSVVGMISLTLTGIFVLVHRRTKRHGQS